MDKQFFARIGVFVLIGINVGAYYVFWPKPEGNAKTSAKPAKEEKGETKLLPTRPKELPKPLADVIPLSHPNSQPKSEAPDDPLGKLLDHINKEKEGPVIVLPPVVPNPFDEKKFTPSPEDPKKQIELPPLPTIPDVLKPKDLPPLKSDPLIGKVGVTSPLTPRMPEGPWQLQTQLDKVSGQTVVIAKLQGEREFRIGCGQFKISPDGTEAVASGGVGCVGVGLTVSCARLTLLLRGGRIIFEDQVVVRTSADPASFMRHDRLVWEFPAIVPADVKPGALGPPK